MYRETEVPSTKQFLKVTELERVECGICTEVWLQSVVLVTTSYGGICDLLPTYGCVCLIELEAGIGVYHKDDRVQEQGTQLELKDLEETRGMRPSTWKSYWVTREGHLSVQSPRLLSQSAAQVGGGWHLYHFSIVA